MFGKLLTKWNKYREMKKWEKKIQYLLGKEDVTIDDIKQAILE